MTTQYKTWDEVPDTLATRTQLSKMGLKPAKDQKPAAIKAGWKRYGPYDLFEIALAVPKRKLTEAQAAALEASRRKAMTTTCCNRYVGVINWWHKNTNMCESCYYDWQESQHLAMLKEAETEASEWARGVLVDPKAVILDTETTGLEGEIVEISIVSIGGRVLLDTLVKPQKPIPESATAIHGIDNEMVKDAPSFAEVYPKIKWIVTEASRVIIYNADFDTSILAWDCQRSDLPALEFKSECAMNWYAAWYGEYSDWFKSFKWKSLGGNHRALGDCLACLERIRTMAKANEESV